MIDLNDIVKERLSESRLNFDLVYGPYTGQNGVRYFKIRDTSKNKNRDAHITVARAYYEFFHNVCTLPDTVVVNSGKDTEVIKKENLRIMWHNEYMKFINTVKAKSRYFVSKKPLERFDKRKLFLHIRSVMIGRLSDKIDGNIYAIPINELDRIVSDLADSLLETMS